MSIIAYLNSKGFFNIENNLFEDSEIIKDLKELTNKPNINLLEINFNSGLLTDILLENNKDLKIVSFDLCDYDYVLTSKEYIDKKFPDRHNLIIGNSVINIPLYQKYNKNDIFDIILINCDKNNEDINIDINNCLSLTNKDSIIIINNYYNSYINLNDCLRDNKIIKINKKDYSKNKQLFYGKYI